MGQPQSQRAGILARIALREAAALAQGQGVGGKREWGDPVHVISMASGTARLSASSTGANAMAMSRINSCRTP